MRIHRTIVTAAFLIAFASPAIAQTADVVGTWEMMFTSDQGPIPAQMVLKKDGSSYVGTISSSLGEASLEAVLKEKALTVNFTMTTGNGPLAVTLNATVDADSLKGTYALNSGAGGEFTGKRQAPSTDDKQPQKQQKQEPADLNGTWSFQITTASISASPTIAFKQEGEKLTGQYNSAQYGQFPLTGTIKGDKVEFSFSMTIEGNSLDVSYSGTVDKDSMKGSVNYGDFAEGTFTATKKK